MPYQTKQQRSVLRCLEERPEEAMTAGAIAELLRQEGRAVSLATIYRQLERLERQGCLHRVDTGEGTVYQFCAQGESACHAGCFLLRCEGCGRIAHLDCVHLESLYRHLEAEHRFSVDLRRTVLTGLCARCRGREAETDGAR